MEYVGGDGRNQGKLKIWDAATGTPISTIPGHRFAFTADFSTIASSEDNIITCYNVDGSARGTMITTSSMIQALALSESSRLAAALSDGTV
jgi:WD40 repeat protein